MIKFRHSESKTEFFISTLKLYLSRLWRLSDSSDFSHFPKEGEMKAGVLILVVVVVVLAFFVGVLWVKIEGLETSRDLTIEALDLMTEHETLNAKRLANNEQSIADLFASDKELLKLVGRMLAYEKDELRLHQQDGQQLESYLDLVPEDAIPQFLAERRDFSAYCILNNFPAPECSSGKFYVRYSGGEWIQVLDPGWTQLIRHLPDDAAYCYVDELAEWIMGKAAVDAVCSIR